MVRVEFYGIPRARAGVGRVEIAQVSTLGELLSELTTRFPEFGRDCANHQLAPQYIANLDGQRFVRDAATTLEGVETVLILSTDAGG